MGLSRPISDIIGEFLSKEVDDEKTLIGLFIKTLRELVKIGQLKEKYNNLFSVNEPQTNIYIVDDEVWIRYQLVSNHIVPQMFTELKPRQVLGYLKNAGMLVLNKGSYECRRSVKNSEKTRESFVVLKRKYYDNRYDSSITDIENNDDWGINPFR